MDYKNAGVDIEAGYKSVELMKKHVKETMRPEVLGGLGGFSGAFSLAAIKNMENPVLLSGTDGCGTKVKLKTERSKSLARIDRFFIKKGEKQLNEYEEKLGLVKRFNDITKQISEMNGIIDELPYSAETERLKEISRKLSEEI